MVESIVYPGTVGPVSTLIAAGLQAGRQRCMVNAVTEAG